VTATVTSIQAIRYARHERKAAENFIAGDDHATDMPLDYYVWAIHRDGASPIVIDTGFGAEAATSRGRTLLRPVDQGLREAGVDPSAVEDVIITHMHYDHAGNLGLFPNARFHIQDAEMAFCTGRAMGHASVRAPFDVEPVTEMVRRVFADRVVFHAGSSTIASGVQVHHVGGHTAGLQIVEVSTQRGPVILASDAAHLYANFTRRIPFPIVVDIPAYLDALDRLDALAPSHSHIVPGHDPLVLALFPAEQGCTDVARVDLEPPSWPDALK
jgi:glyoxylase-like metal-dependent hydrolase (beta-lactamase superfamily II)